MKQVKAFYTRYNQLLLRKPLVTNMLTTGFLFGSGDFMAQKFFSVPTTSYDYLRTIKAVVYGGIVFAPIGDKWYKLLNRIKFPISRSTRANLSGSKKELILDTSIRVATDQLIFAPFIGIPMYYTVMAFWEFKPDPISEIRAKLRDNLWDTLTTNWLVWPLFQVFNFGLVPVQFRLLTVNVISIGWNCYLSYLLNDKQQHFLEVKEEEIMI